MVLVAGRSATYWEVHSGTHTQSPEPEDSEFLAYAHGSRRVCAEDGPTLVERVIAAEGADKYAVLNCAVHGGDIAFRRAPIYEVVVPSFADMGTLVYVYLSGRAFLYFYVAQTPQEVAEKLGRSNVHSITYMEDEDVQSNE